MYVLNFDPGLDTSPGFKCHGLDPKNVKVLPGFRVLSTKTQKKYVGTWLQFIQQYKISVGKTPSEADVYNFLEAKFAAGQVSSTVSTTYSHLNLACQELYKVGLDKLPSLCRLLDLLKSPDADEFSDNDDKWMEEAANSGTPTSESSVGKFNLY